MGPPVPKQKTMLSLFVFGPHFIGHAREIQQTIQADKNKQTTCRKYHVHSSLMIHTCMVGVPPSYCELHFINTALEIIRTIAISSRIE